MAQIFFSYASADRARIAPIVARLEAAGWSVFWDRKTPVGMSWEDHIHQQLEGSECVLVAWSQNSVTSDWVREEALHGKQRACLVPLLLEPVAPPFGFGQIQCAELSTAGADPQHPEWRNLIAAIERRVPRPGPTGDGSDRPAGDAAADYSDHWQRLLNARDHEALTELAAELQALRVRHPTDPELIKLQRKVGEARARSRPSPALETAAAGPRRHWALGLALASVLAAVIGIGIYL